MRRKVGISVVVLAASGLLRAGAAPAVTIPITLGKGANPGVGIDASGMAYVAWNAPETSTGSRPQFCRVPPGAAGCEGGAPRELAIPGTSLTAPWVVVSGERVVVVQARYGEGVPGFTGIFRITSTDGGRSFGDAFHVGSTNFTDAVVGPGDTISGFGEQSLHARFENISLNATADETGWADLTTPEAAVGVVGLQDGTTPFVVMLGDGDQAAWRRYTGTGSVNDAANWTAPAAFGAIRYPKLAGGGLGLFVSGLTDEGVLVRKFDGATFGPPVFVGKPGQAGTWLEQDAGARLHLLYARSDGNGYHLVHAVSDDGAAWRQGDLVHHTTSADGAFDGFRSAIAADHTGAIVYRNGSNDIRLARMGPDAPSAQPAPAPVAPTPSPTPVAKPLGRLTGTGSAKRRGPRVKVRVSLTLVLPSGIRRQDGCAGKVTVSLLRRKKLLRRVAGTIGSTCTVRLRTTLRRSAVGRTRSLRVNTAFSGNTVLAPSVQKNGFIRVR